jgi:hypothetical protein
VSTEIVSHLQHRRAQLLALKLRVEAELEAVSNGIRMAQGLAGRPRKPPTHTVAEEAEAQRRWMAGERTHWVEQGHRQRLRNLKRAERARRRAS